MSLDDLLMAAPTPLLDDRFPLTPLQQGMLFQSLTPSNPGVNIEQIVCSFSEELSLAEFRAAWRQTARRHPALRTSIRWEDLDEAVQDVHRDVPFDLEYRDFRGLDVLAAEG